MEKALFPELLSYKAAKAIYSIPKKAAKEFLTALSFHVLLWLIDRPNSERPLRWHVSLPSIKPVLIYDQNRIELPFQTIVDKSCQARALYQMSRTTYILVIPRDLNVVAQGVLFQPESLEFQYLALYFYVSALIYPAI